jgi:hypothetical protein
VNTMSTILVTGAGHLGVVLVSGLLDGGTP